MTEDDDDPEFLDALDSFFKRKGATDRCPVCGKDKWGVASPGPHAPHAISILPTRRKHLPVYAMVCMNCGFVRLHAQPVVDEALNPAPAPGQDKDGAE